MLHLTNGDNTVGLLTKADIQGRYFAWRDVLHDGPVPYHKDTVELAKVRATFIAACGWGNFDGVLADFMARDQELTDLSNQEELVLWFEHDLYDQLQIIQVMDRLAQLPESRRPKRWTMICINAFPGIANFHGLGQLRPKDMKTLLPQRAPITQDQIQLGKRAWRAFCHATPEKLQELMETDLTALPFLKDALHRHLQQFPNTQVGLNLSESLTLEGLATGVVQAGALFRYQNNREFHPFLGDWSYWQILRKLAGGSEPAIAFSKKPGPKPSWHLTVQLTDFGKALLNGEGDFVQSNGMDQWFGGVHLKGKNVPWRYEPNLRHLVATVPL